MTDPRLPDARPDSTPVSSRRLRLVLSFLATVAIFALLGRILASLITVFAFVPARLPIHFTKPGLAFVGAFAYGLWLGFPLGFLVNGAIGVVVAIRDRMGGTRWFEVAILALIVAGGWAIFFAKGYERGLFTAIAIVASVVASLVAWKATRWLWRLG